MAGPDRRGRLLRRLVASLGFLFGAATVLAGSRVLAGADPGYVVFRPLLLYNTAMGVGYLAASILVWRGHRFGNGAAVLIFLCNAVVLAAIALLRWTGSPIASESLGAMTVRTVAWGIGALVLLRLDAGRSVAWGHTP